MGDDAREYDIAFISSKPRISLGLEKSIGSIC